MKRKRESTTQWIKSASKLLRRIWVVLFLVWSLFAAQEISVPVDLQFRLFLKILDFDRNLKTRVGDEIVFGIVYQKTFVESVDTKNELVKAIEQSALKKIDNIPIRYILIELKNENSFVDAVSEEKVDILYITPLRGFDIRILAHVCKAKKIMSLTGVPSYVSLGISIGFNLKGQKTEIIINLRSAKAEGADFSSKLLHLTRVIE
jgi:hypothetical protein